MEYFCPKGIAVMDNHSIKENIRAVRESKKYTQVVMADMMGMSLSSYKDFEKGRTSIVNSNLAKFADLLETTSEELVLGYRPIQMEGPGVEDVKAEYAGKVNTLEKRIAELEKMVAYLEETIVAKNEIISMLKKSLDGEQ